MDYVTRLFRILIVIGILGHTVLVADYKEDQ